MTVAHHRKRQLRNRRHTASRTGWLVAAVSVPLLTLGLLSFLGIRAQKAAAWTRAREEAATVTKAQAQLLSTQLQSALLPIPRFPDPLIPGTAAPADAVLDGTDREALAALRDDPDAGLSPSGLPRQALAGLRLFALAPAQQDAAALVVLLSNDAPSLLTPVGLQHIQASHPEVPIPPQWEHLPAVEDLIRRHPDGGWINDGGETWWIAPDRSRFLPPGALTVEDLEVPPYAEIRLSTNRSASDGEVLAEAPVAFPAGLAVQWVLTGPESIDASTRRQTRWTLALLAVSLLGSGIGLAAILHTVRRERRLHELKSQFVASVSHELRAPLGSIRLMAEALEENRVEQPAEFHRMISRESGRLAHLVENVLDFARIEENRRHYAFEETDLAALTRETLELLSPRATESGQVLEPSLEPVTAAVDRPAFQQALVNLIDNALKFSPQSTTVTIALTADPTHWSLAITDEGPGVPRAERQRIFERFHRLGDELRRETQGTGIGLSIVKHIAEAHHGEVAVTCKPTTFTLRAPLHPPARP